ncbi:MAG: hypothetical protein R2939_17655 [Kofleriaceae bacterium]
MARVDDHPPPRRGSKHAITVSLPRHRGPARRVLAQIWDGVLAWASGHASAELTVGAVEVDRRGELAAAADAAQGARWNVRVKSRWPARS